ncbi:MBL fold metallo-hydrolase [Candidatus Peregrinibacteria bacterium]|nr:MBL fold metallo-hydrolase [Candidatus Peregrinibacteria bacterium]
MDIIWHGHACFSLKTKDTTIITDPYGGIGLKLPNLTADVVTVSHAHEDHSNIKAISGNPKIFDWPGEYEVAGIPISGIEAFHYAESEGPEAEQRGKIIIFTIEIEGIKVCHLGDLGHKLTSELIEAIGTVDVLLIPVGGTYSLDHKKAHQVIEQIDPRIVIPMHYKIEGLNLDIAPVELFLKEVGKLNLVPMEKLRLKKSDLPQENTDFVVLTPVIG